MLIPGKLYKLTQTLDFDMFPLRFKHNDEYYEFMVLQQDGILLYLKSEIDPDKTKMKNFIFLYKTQQISRTLSASTANLLLKPVK